MLKKVQNVFWYAFVFFLPWQTAWIVREVFIGGEKWQYATGLLYVSDIALLGALLVFLLRSNCETWRVALQDAVFRALFALFFWSLLSVLWAVRADIALLMAWKLFLMLSAYVFFRFGGALLRTMLLVFLTSMSVQAALGMAQWMGQYVYPSSVLGIAEHDPAQWGTSVLKAESGRWLRVYGGFEHPNVFGGALSVSILLGVWLVSRERVSAFRMFLLGVSVLFAFALVLTFSRSAWSALFLGGAGLFLGSLIHWKRHVLQRGIFARAVAALGIVVFSFSIAFVLLRETTTSRFSESTIVREGSVSDREMYIKQSFAAIREHPIMGVGGGNFTAFTQERFPESGRFIADFQPVHMVPLLIFSELGVVGFILFSCIFFFLFLRAFRNRDELSLALLLALVPLLSLDHFFWTSHFGLMFLGMIFGVISFSFEGNKKQA